MMSLLLLIGLQVADAEKAVTAERLKAHLTHLASDELEGRNAGTEGNRKAAEYIAGKLKEWRLKPAGDEGTYFQEFSFAESPFGGEERRTRNILALVEGGEEVVVIGAHYDHVGTRAQKHMGQAPSRGSDDTIYNGADDNGSGTTALLGVAQGLAEAKVRPQRSILLIWFSAEESGLWGSKHYVDHPIRDLSKHAAMINMDMVGRNPERPVEIAGVATDGGGQLRPAVEAAVKATGLTARLVGYGDIKSQVSDHHPFFEREVPVMFFFTGFHPDYHKVGDHADKIAYERLEQIARTALRVGMALADAEGGLAFRPPRALDLRRRGSINDEEAAGLGLADGQGAVEVRSIRRGSAVASAGIVDGDFIIALDGAPLPRAEAHKTLYDWLESAPARQSHAVELIRGGERKTVTIEWEN